MIRKRLGVRLSAIELLEPRHMFAGDPLAEWRFDSNSGNGARRFDRYVQRHHYRFERLQCDRDRARQRDAGLDGVQSRRSGARARKTARCVCSAIRTARLVDAAVAPQVLSVSLWFKADTTNPTRYTSTTANGGSTSGTSVAMPLFESGDSASGLNIYIYNNRLYVGAWNSACRRLVERHIPVLRRERDRCRPLAPCRGDARSDRRTPSQRPARLPRRRAVRRRAMARRSAGQRTSASGAPTARRDFCWAPAAPALSTTTRRRATIIADLPATSTRLASMARR